jgi:exonuclease V gamma subunit
MFGLNADRRNLDDEKYLFLEALYLIYLKIFIIYIS